MREFVRGEQVHFTAWVESLKPMTDVVQILAGLGVVTIALGFAKYSAERRCWRRFKRRANGWVNRQVELKEETAVDSSGGSEDSHREFAVFDKDILTVVVEGMLTDAGFTPLQTQQILDMSLLLVRGMAADKFLI